MLKRIKEYRQDNQGRAGQGNQSSGEKSVGIEKAKKMQNFDFLITTSEQLCNFYITFFKNLLTSKMVNEVRSRR